MNANSAEISNFPQRRDLGLESSVAENKLQTATPTASGMDSSHPNAERFAVRILLRTCDKPTYTRLSDKRSTSQVALNPQAEMHPDQKHSKLIRAIDPSVRVPTCDGKPVEEPKLPKLPVWNDTGFKHFKEERQTLGLTIS